MRTSLILLFSIVVLTSGCISSDSKASSYNDGSYILTEDLIYQTDFYNQSGLTEENLYMVDRENTTSLESEALQVQEAVSFTANLPVHSMDTFEDMPNGIFSSQFEIDNGAELEPIVEDHTDYVRDSDTREVRNFDTSGDRIVLEESEVNNGEVERYIVSVFNREGSVGYELTLVDFEEEPLGTWEELADMKDEGMKDYIKNN